MRNSLLIASLAFAACAHTESGAPQKESIMAQAILEAKSGSTVGGQAVFLKTGPEISMQIDVTNAPPGTHAVHLHVNGDCSADDAQSAGPHWNPGNEQHGHLDHGPAHMGDIGNIEVGDDGHGTLTFTTKDWSAASGLANDVVGHAVVVHAVKDDFTSQPAGNAGTRIACGVVKATGPTPPVITGAAR